MFKAGMPSQKIILKSSTKGNANKIFARSAIKQTELSPLFQSTSTDIAHGSVWIFGK